VSQPVNHATRSDDLQPRRNQHETGLNRMSSRPEEAIMDRSRLTRLAAVALATGVAVTLAAPPAGAGASGRESPAASPAPAADQLAALAHDLGLTPDQAEDRLARELAASHTAQALRQQLAGGYAGAWLDGDRLVVGITDPADATAVRAAGAEPELVQFDESELTAAVSKLDRADPPDPADVYSWGVDVRANLVLIRAATEAVVRVRVWVITAGLDLEMIRVEASTGKPTPAWDIIGGNRYNTSSGSCSIGFSVTRGPGDRGFVTAGHCGTVGTVTSAFNGSNTIELGTFANSNFPGVDMAYVKAKIYAGCTRPGNQNCWFSRPWVNRYAAGGVLTVAGHQVAPIGAATCRSGATTGWHCGTITAVNQTVNYPQGQVNGLTFTTVCVEPGDSGGAYVALGDHAQGVTSGGTTPLSCATPDRTSFFQPLNPILGSYGLTLVTG
jgi:streptogrisin C